MIAGQVPVVMADTITLPGIEQKDSDRLDFGPCENEPHSQANCVRVLACIGVEGIWFDGQARGWDAGEVVGQLSTGQPCAGNWSSQGIAGTGWSELTCKGQLRAQVIYHTLDNETGTVEGTGIDSFGRVIKAWSGLSVLEFLEKKTGKVATLPCGDGSGAGDVPIS